MISKIDLLLIITNSNEGLLQKQCAYTIKTSLGGIEKISSDAKREDKRFKKIDSALFWFVSAVTC